MSTAKTKNAISKKKTESNITRLPRPSPDWSWHAGPQGVFPVLLFCGPIRNHLVFVHPSDTPDCVPLVLNMTSEGTITVVKDGTDISNSSKLRMAPLIADDERRLQLRPTLLCDFGDRDAGRLDVERQELESDITGSQIGSWFDRETRTSPSMTTEKRSWSGPRAKKKPQSVRSSILTANYAAEAATADSRSQIWPKYTILFYEYHMWHRWWLQLHNYVISHFISHKCWHIDHQLRH